MKLQMESEKTNDKSWLKMFLCGSKAYKTKTETN